jgi:hypothetical protein
MTGRLAGPVLLAAMGAVMGAGLAARDDERSAGAREQRARSLAARDDEPSAGAREQRARSAAGVTWRLPAGWHAVRRRVTGIGDPHHVLAAATFSVRPARGCAPHRPPAGGALVLLLESRWAAGVPRRLRRFPPRPARFRLAHEAVAYECLGLGRMIAFRERERAFQAAVMLGRRAGRHRLREAERLLDGLEVAAIPPPERPVWDAWRLLITESGDSMRVPPGWRAHALAVPRRHPRPRVLFSARTDAGAVAPGHDRHARSEPELDRRGVVLRVIERRPGPASRRFPPLDTDPFARRERFDDRGRAGAAWRGYRFEVIVSAPRGVAPRDVDRAFAAASSLALSGGHRDCTRPCIRGR